MSKHKTKKEILEDLKKNIPRIGFEGLFCFEICSKAYTLVKEARAEEKKLREPQPKDGKLYRFGAEGLGLLDEIRKQECIAIAFAAICLEACIWDYAACNMSQNKAKENFESLNLVAKWVVIPQLLCGSDITKIRIGDTNLLGKLRELKTARNELVHPKSKPLPDNYNDAVEAIMAERKRIKVEDAFGLIGLLLGELEEVDKTNWWFFQTPAYRNSIKKHQSETTPKKEKTDYKKQRKTVGTKE